jgi:hypothetical protein
MKQKIFLSIWLIGILIFGASCATASTVNPTPTLARATLPPVLATPTLNATPAANLANVDSVQIRILESFPVQVQAVAKGNLPDSCTTIDQAKQTREGNTFKITLTTKRPADAMCAQVLTPFEHTIALDVSGLPKGKYEVIVNNANASFELKADNSLGTPTGATTKKIVGEFVMFEVPSHWNPNKRPLFGGAVWEDWQLGIPGVMSDQALGFSEVAFNQARPNDIASETVITIGGKRGVKWIRHGANYVSYDYYTTGRNDRGSFGVHVTLSQKDANIEAQLDRLITSIAFK